MQGGWRCCLPLGVGTQARWKMYFGEGPLCKDLPLGPSPSLEAWLREQGLGAQLKEPPMRKEVAVGHPGPPSPALATHSALNKCL